MVKKSINDHSRLAVEPVNPNKADPLIPEEDLDDSETEKDEAFDDDEIKDENDGFEEPEDFFNDDLDEPFDDEEFGQDFDGIEDPDSNE